MNDYILKQLSNKLYEIGRKFDLAELRVRSDRYSSEIYVINNHALQLEIDWRENNLFMYVVYLKNNTLPDENVIYSYADGQWCRKYLEELYKTKRIHQKDRSKRYSAEYLFECFDYYAKLIENNPLILEDFLHNI